MGTARFETILDYARYDVDAAIRCGGCGHTRYLKLEQLEAIFGLGTRIGTAARRLKCSKCGHKGAKVTPVPRLDA
jgi:hypothetical protein